MATTATTRAESLLGAGASNAVAWTDGFQRGFLVSSFIPLAAVAAAAVVIRREEAVPEVAAA